MKKSKNLLILAFGLFLTFNLISCKKINNSTSNDLQSESSEELTSESQKESEKESSSTIEDVYNLEVNKDKVELVVGDEEKIEVTLTKNGKAITDEINFVSNDESVVSISEDGTISAFKEGNVTITISAYNIVKEIEVNVEAPEIFLLLDKDSLNLRVNESYTLNPLVNYGTLPSLTYTSSNENVATVTDAGLISAVGEGECEIEVKASESLYTTCKVAVTNTYDLIFPEISAKECYVGDEIEVNAFVRVNGITSKEGLIIETNDKASVTDDKITILDDGEVIISVSYPKCTEKLTQTIISYNKVSTVEDFKNIQNDLDGFYKLANNINFNNERIDTIAHYEAGYTTNDSGFAGTFDGQGYSLMNVSFGYLSKSYANSSAFGTIAKTGIVKNTNFVNVTIDNRICGTIATMNYGTISNCYVESSIPYETDESRDTNNPLGAIAAKNWGTIEYCVATVNITTTKTINIGAIVGRNYVTGVINECYALANVGVVESATPTNDPTSAASGKITNANTFTELSILNEKVKSFSEIWEVIDGKYPHLINIDNNTDVTINEYNAYPGYDVELQGIISNTSYTLKLKENVNGISLDGNKVIIASSATTNTKVTIIVSNNYGGTDKEITININEPLVTVLGPDTITFVLNNKESKTEDYKKSSGLTILKGTETYTGSYQLVSSDEDVFEVSGTDIIAKETGKATLSVIIDDTTVYQMDVEVKITHVIETTDEFLAIGKNSKTMSYDYILANDLDFEGATIKAFSSYWSNTTQNLVFSGTFDGQNHTIANFMPTYDGTFHENGKSDRDCSIFGYLSATAVVKNVNFVGVKLFDRSSVVSSYNLGTIENIYIEANYIKYGGVNRNANNPAGIIVSKMAGGSISNCIVKLVIADDASIYASDNTTICFGSFVGAANAGEITNCYSICADSRVNFYSKKDTCTLTNTNMFATIDEFYANVDTTLFNSNWTFDATNKYLPHLSNMGSVKVVSEANAYNNSTFDLSSLVSSTLTTFSYVLNDDVTNVSIDGNKLVIGNVSANTTIELIATDFYSSYSITITVKELELTATSVDSLSFDFIKGESEETEYTKAHNVKVVTAEGTDYTGEVTISSSNTSVATVVGDNIVAVGDGVATISVSALGTILKEFTVNSIMYNPIKTVEDYVAIGKDKTTLSLKYKLMNDIDFENQRVNTLAHYSAGYTSNTNGFSGIFDGQGYCLKNMSFGYNNASSANSSAFGTVAKTGVIKNVNFINATIDNRICGTIATMNFGTISNCYVEATISYETNESKDTNNPIGGISSKNWGTIENSVAYIIITATKTVNIGAIVGRNYATGLVNNCVAISSVGVFESATPTNDPTQIDAGSTTNSGSFESLSALISDETIDTTKLTSFMFTTTSIIHNEKEVHTTI